eukprot:2873523-Amphidinium_carterae.2
MRFTFGDYRQEGVLQWRRVVGLRLVFVSPPPLRAVAAQRGTVAGLVPVQHITSLEFSVGPEYQKKTPVFC